MHIVCLDAPSPPNYGGAIDMFFKIKGLAAIGKKITLHYFDYNKARATEGLEQYCEAIHSYNRKSFFDSSPLSKPYIIASRVNSTLIERLNADRNPILLEGLHCAGILPHIKSKDRVVLRMHNEEAAYYHHLAVAESFFLKKLYFKRESHLLKKYQLSLDRNCKLACLSKTDIDSFEKDYHFSNAHFIPCFIPWQSINIKEGFGEYCLYHGNMAVSENDEAAGWLIDNVFSKLSVPFVIAGKGISSTILRKSKSYSKIKIVADPPIDELQQLVRDAHINVLPSMNRTGVKLKLLNALINGRYCITNSSGVMGSGLEEFIKGAENAEAWATIIPELMNMQFTSSETLNRNKILELYNNESNAVKLNELWSHYL